jgi:hypothetical protein
VLAVGQHGRMVGGKERFEVGSPLVFDHR